MRIAVLTPTYAGYDEETRNSIRAMLRELSSIEFIFLRVTEVYIHAARRKLLEEAMRLHRQHNFDYFLWLDSDVEFTPRHVMMMVSYLKMYPDRILTGVYFSRHGNHNPMICIGNQTEGFNFQIDIIKLMRKRYNRIDACGMGFLMVAANTMEHYTGYYVATEWFDSSGWFPTDHGPENQRYVVGEDLYFCDKMNQIGHQLYADAHILLSHKGIGLQDWERMRNKPIPHCAVMREHFEPEQILQITKRAVLYVGFVCNLRCNFCYYAHDTNKRWRPLTECKREASLFRNGYGNMFVDLTGGEPSAYPNIHRLIEHCRGIELAPTIITNLQKLANPGFVKSLKTAGIHDLLCSVHGLGERYDSLTRVHGSFEKVKAALKNIADEAIPFRINCTLTNQNIRDLRIICEFCIDHGAKVINFISFNPFYEWEKKCNQDFQARFRDIEPYLIEALDYCSLRDVEANVRYYPFCLVGRHLDKCYNFSQLPYDPNEWDYKSWYSQHTDAPCHKFPDAFYDQFKSKEEAYYAVAKTQKHRLYAKSDKCSKCSLRRICDGLTTQYMTRFGDEELKPSGGQQISDPTHFIASRMKYQTP